MLTIVQTIARFITLQINITIVHVNFEVYSYSLEIKIKVCRNPVLSL